MDTQFHTLEGCKREVEIALTKNDLEPHYIKAYREAQKSVDLPGFRKGKVPLNVVKQRFGKQIRDSALEDIANEVYQSVLKENELKTIGPPVLKDIAKENNGSVKFTISYEVHPEFELGEYKGLTVDKPVVEVNEQLVDDAIERVTFQHASLEDAEQVEDESFTIAFELRKLDPASQLPIIGGEVKEEEVFLRDENLDPDFKASFMNSKIGDTFNYKTKTPEDQEEQAESELLHITIKGIKRVVPAEFSNDLVETISKGRFFSTEEYREQVETELRQQYDKRSSDLMQEMLIGKIIDAHEFEAPDSLVVELINGRLKEMQEQMPDKKLPPDFDVQRYAENARPSAARSAKWILIRDKIIQKEELKVVSEDYDKFSADLAAKMQLAYDQIRPIVETSDQFESQILNEKVMNMLVDYAIITELEQKPEH